MNLILAHAVFAEKRGRVAGGKPIVFGILERQTFLLHIKECEFRFHHREEDLSDRMLTLLKENPL